MKSTAPWCTRVCESGTLIDLPQAATPVAASRQRTMVRVLRVTGGHLTREEPAACRRNPERPGGTWMILHLRSTRGIRIGGDQPPGPIPALAAHGSRCNKSALTPFVTNGVRAVVLRRAPAYSRRALTRPTSLRSGLLFLRGLG